MSLWDTHATSDGRFRFSSAGADELGVTSRRGAGSRRWVALALTAVCVCAASMVVGVTDLAIACSPAALMDRARPADQPSDAAQVETIFGLAHMDVIVVGSVTRVDPSAVLGRDGYTITVAVEGIGRGQGFAQEQIRYRWNCGLPPHVTVGRRYVIGASSSYPDQDPAAGPFFELALELRSPGLPAGRDWRPPVPGSGVEPSPWWPRPAAAAACGLLVGGVAFTLRRRRRRSTTAA